MNYSDLIDRGAGLPSHAELTNLSYSHGGYTTGIKRTADQAGLKQEIDAESIGYSTDDDDPLRDEIASSYARAMNVQNIPHTGNVRHMQGLTTLPSAIPVTSVATSSQPKPQNGGKKTKGRVKIKMEFIDNKLRRYTTFSKRKTGIMKKAYELSTLTGTQVMLLVASETGHVYTFATRKLQPMITSDAGKALIQTCLNSPDPPPGPGTSNDQRMMPSGFEETELSYNVSSEEEQKESQEFDPLVIKSEDICSRESSPVSSGSTSTSPVQENHKLHPRIATAINTGSSTASSTSSQTPSVTVTKVPSTAATSSSCNPVMYHTAQGVVYAVPSTNPEGLLLNLNSYLLNDKTSSKKQRLEYKGNPGSSSQNILTIPLPSSLAESHGKLRK